MLSNKIRAKREHSLDTNSTPRLAHVGYVLNFLRLGFLKNVFFFFFFLGSRESRTSGLCI